MQVRSMTAGLTSLIVALSCAGCDDAKKEPLKETAGAATSAPTPPPPPPEPEHKAAPQPSRPEKIDQELTPERRTKAEETVPDAKGFLVATSLEDKLKANKKLKEKAAGVTAFDKMASGKWVLFTGPIANLTDSGFDLGITYTPQIPGDMMGMSRQWFPVTFSDVKGYDASKFKVGQMVIVLARYAGKQKATPGTELVEAKAW